MKKVCIWVSFYLIFGFMSVDAEIFRVPGEYSTIQEAVNEANNEYDLVLIDPGTYSGPGNRDILIDGKDINLRGDGDPSEVIIDVRGNFSEPHRAFDINGYGWAHLNITNLTIINGNTGEDSGEGGAGILAKEVDLFVSDCIFNKNESLGNGGGICLLDLGGGGSLICQESVFIENTGNDGGAIYCHDLIVSGSEFNSNSSCQGGGIGGGGEIYIDECAFYQNSASEDGGAISSFYYVCVRNSVFTENSSALYGGAISILAGEYTKITECIFTENQSSEGGGADIWGSKYLDLANNLFFKNSATLYGGALVIHGSSFADVWNCTFSKNNSGGKAGALILDEGYLDIENSIFWENSAQEGAELVVTDEFFNQYPAEMRVNNSLVTKSNCREFGDQTSLVFGENIIEISPEFHNKDSDDYRLSSYSPCVDNGRNDRSPDYDLNYNARSVGVAPDIGAYEYQTAYDYGCHLLMEDTELSFGDHLSLSALVVVESEISSVDLVVVLEYAGSYYFYPLWKPGFSTYPLQIHYGRIGKEIVSFEWPLVPGSVAGLKFWGAILDPSTMNLVGTVDCVPWSFY